MQIAPMKKSHLKQVINLEKLCFENDAWSVHLFHSELSSKYSYYISVIDDAKRVIGYAGSRIVLDEAELVNICVDPSFRCKGIGKSLLEYFINTWNEKNVKKAFLEVRVSNEKAIKLYEKYGFMKISVRELYYEGIEDAYVMMLDMNKV